ncbi:MAG: tRNA pseudouridine(13) synthase TruD [Thaumarchaeota archaeon]|nr:tRNA pseudouridine(13) synthase TruD [Nitrososphaerota archaeon]
MTEAAAVESAVGIEVYATAGDRCGGVAKSSAEDFRVEEMVSVGEMGKEPLPGYFPVYRVEKLGVDTMHMAELLSRALKSRVS